VFCSHTNAIPVGIDQWGRASKKYDGSDVHLLQRQKKSSYLLCFIFAFVFIFSSTFLARVLGVS
jgi:hypothetical protein